MGSGKCTCGLNSQDGIHEDVYRQFDDPDKLEPFLAGLSTYGRFLRFVHDFLREVWPSNVIQFRQTEIEGEKFAILRLRDAVEFMSKKDYIDNWASEMFEEFAFWGFSNWKEAMRNAGIYSFGRPQRARERVSRLHQSLDRGKPVAG